VRLRYFRQVRVWRSNDYRWPLNVGCRSKGDQEFSGAYVNPYDDLMSRKEGHALDFHRTAVSAASTIK
jgi:hypothetical protein